MMSITHVVDGKEYKWDRLSLYGLEFSKYKKNITQILNDKRSVSVSSSGQLPMLHVAVIIGSLTAVQKILQRGACVNMTDDFGWTPLHHATLWDVDEIKTYLIEQGAVQIAATQSGITCAMIESWLHPEIASVEDVIPLIWEDNGMRSQLTYRQFEEITGAQYVKNYVMTRDVLLQETWSHPDRPGFVLLPDVVRAYREKRFEEMSLLMKNTKYLGVSLFALKPIVRWTLLGEYFGRWQPQEAEEDGRDLAYRFGMCNAKKFRNELAMVNDGFPNLAFLTLNNEGGLSKRCIVMAIEDIQAEDIVCVDYGLQHSIKMLGYRELRPNAVRAWARGLTDHAMVTRACVRILKAVRERDVNMSLEELAFVLQLSYVAHTPSVLCALRWEDLLEEKIYKQIRNLSIALFKDHIRSFGANMPQFLSLGDSVLQQRRELAQRGFVEASEQLQKSMQDECERLGVQVAYGFFKELKVVMTDTGQFIETDEQFCVCIRVWLNTIEDLIQVEYV